ncbi:MAG: hypothetical protein IB618_01795 [Candidatus Pacearchaeota archaeon]|nr:MAG: hypothetical protein IB618_01795 [Candidatus Pacearchaeota archaeon]
MEKKLIKIFEGTYNEIMPSLRKKGFKPATAEEIQKLRLENQLSFDSYYDTATGIFYTGNNQDKFKIIPYSQDLANVTQETELYNGGIKKTQEEYENAKASEFKRKDMILGERLTEKEALKHLGWLNALNGNKELLEKIVEHVFKEVKNRYGEKEAMGFYLRNTQEVPDMRALHLCGLYGSHGAGASDFYDLEDGARLVGEKK